MKKTVMLSASFAIMMAGAPVAEAQQKWKVQDDVTIDTVDKLVQTAVMTSDFFGFYTVAREMDKTTRILLR